MKLNLGQCMSTMLFTIWYINKFGDRLKLEIDLIGVMV